MATKLVYDVKTKETRTEEIANFVETNPRIFEIEERLQEIKGELSQTDYKAIKYAEGQYTEEEYADIKKARQDLRDEYNTIEKELETLTW